MPTDQTTALLIVFLLVCFTRVLQSIFRRGVNRNPAGKRRRPITAKASRSAVGRTRCLHCGTLLEIALPPATNIVTCPTCEHRFAVLLWDADHNLYISALEPRNEDKPVNARSDAERVAHWLALLELDSAGDLNQVSLREIRRAYYRSVRRYHPDRYHHLPTEFRMVAERKTRLLHEAYRELLRLKSGVEERADSVAKSRGPSLPDVSTAPVDGLKQ